MTDPADCWVEVPAGSDFTLANLPLGVAGDPEWLSPHVVVAIGDHAVDCHLARLAGLLDAAGLPAGVLDTGSLNKLLRLGRPALTRLRNAVHDLLTQPEPPAVHVLHRREDLRMLLPIEVADYVDFYSSEHHARNLGAILRPGEEPLAPNWKHLPVGYGGRAGSVVVSGTQVVRPHGMIAGSDGEPAYSAGERLDYELEVGAVVATPSRLGSPVTAADAEEHLAGLVLLNDWSARDIQAYEYRPLGPNVSKSFATSISPWLVTLDALQPFRVESPAEDPPPAAHLWTPKPSAFDITVEVSITTAAMRHDGRPPFVVARTNFSTMYWTVAQQLAHLTSGGAAMRTGDLLGSGTVSGPERGAVGSLMEATWGGAEPLLLPDGEQLTFLQDGDEVIMRGWAGDGADRVGFGTVTGRVVADPPASREA